MQKHILLTGEPRTGKTTLLKRIIQNLKISCGGFYTEEIIKNNKRRGFRIKTLDGKEGILALQGLKSKFRLGKYGINLKDLDEIGVDSVFEALKDKKIIIIDEIGKMELFSQKFKDAVLKTLNSKKRLIGIIHRENSKFLRTIKARDDVEIFEIDLSNQEGILKKILSMLGSPGQGKKKGENAQM